MRRAAALLLTFPIAVAAEGYMRCHVEDAGPRAATCFLPLVNATYSCALRAGPPECVDAQLNAIACIQTSASRDGPGLACIPGAALPGEPVHIVITGDRAHQPPPITLGAPPRQIARRRTPAEEPRRYIPTIEDLMRGPPRPSPEEQALIDAREAMEEATESAKAAADAAGAAARAAGEVASRRPPDPYLYTPTPRPFSCYRSGSYLYCN